MNPDVFLPIAFTILIALLGLMVAVGIPRGKWMQRTNRLKRTSAAFWN